MGAVLELVGICKDYGKHRVLRELSFSLAPGEILGYFGLNGAGKSTTNRIILGFCRPSAGSFRLLGEDGANPRARRRLGFLPENPYYYDYLSGRELLDYAARLQGVPSAERPARIREAIDRVRLASEAADRPIRTYSKGMLQRLGLAQALVHRPEFLLLDEPFSGLDPLGRTMLKELLRDFRSAGGTVFFSSHQLLDAQEICDRVAILHEGVLQVAAPLAELTARHPGLTLEQIFLTVVGQASEESVRSQVSGVRGRAEDADP